MFEFLKRKKKKEKEKFVPRAYKFYGGVAERLYRLYDEHIRLGTKEARYRLWAGINKRVSDVDITEEGEWTIKLVNALVFKITEDEE